MDLQNYYSNAECILTQREVEVIPAVMGDTLTNIMHRFDVAGSCLLTGKKNGCDQFETIFEFDFEKGTNVGTRYADMSSRQVVEHVAEFFSSKRKTGGYIAAVDDGKVDEEILVLHTNDGVLNCNICMDFPYTEVELYMTIAKTIAMMRPTDKKTQEAYQQLLNEEGRTSPTVWMIDAHVDDLFNGKCHIPQLIEWKKWHTRQAKR